MQKEYEEHNDETAAQFKNLLFAHAVINGIPKLYYEIYPVEPREDDIDEEWTVPRTQEELQDMLGRFQVSRMA